MSLKKHKTFTKAMSLSLLLGLAFSGIAAYFTSKAYIFERDTGGQYLGEIEPEIRGVYAHKMVTPSDNKYSTQKSYSMNIVGDIESTWNSYTGAGTTIAVIDDGFDHDHGEFTRSDGTSAISNDSAYFYASGSSYGVKYYKNTPTCIDEDWDSDEGEWATHGTNVASTAAAPMGNGGVVGIAPEATILALKIDFQFVSIRAAINYAVEKGADVINMSLGAFGESFTDGFGDSQSGSSTAATYLNSACQNAYNNNVIVVAAAGNEATWHKSYPACNTKVIGVGALYKNDASKLAPFTNYVKTDQTGEINVDILAPGFVYAAGVGGSTSSSHTATYNNTQGTSFSSPIVAGAACLWKQKYPNGTPDEFLDQLQDSAAGKGTYNSKYVPVSMYQGYDNDVGPSNISQGRLDVGALMSYTNDVNNISMSQTSMSLYTSGPQKTGTLSATITPPNADDLGVTWTTSNSSVVSLNKTSTTSGQEVQITANNAGSATITAKSKENPSISATCSITVGSWVSVTGISLLDSNGQSSSTIAKRDTVQLVPTIAPANATNTDFIVESNNTSIATVDSNYLVKGVGAGTTTIEALIEDDNGNYLSALYTVTVTAPEGEGEFLIDIYDSTTIGDSSSTTGANLAFFTDKVTVDGTINNNIVTNYSSTTTYIRKGGLALGTSKKNGSFTITLHTDYPVNMVKVIGTFWDTTGSLKVNGSAASSGSLNTAGAVLTACTNELVFDGLNGATSLEFAATNRVVVYQILCTYEIPEVVNVTGVSLNQTAASLDVYNNQTITLTATVTPNNATTKSVTWSTSNNEVATVHNGLVTAVGEGICTITVTTNSGGKQATCAITVTDSTPTGGGDPTPVSGSGNFEKVTSTNDLEDGEYLIVCEDSDVAFDGSLDSLDVVNNKIGVTINNGEITGTDDLYAATFTLDESEGSLRSASGYYIGNAANSNSLTTSSTSLSNSITITGAGNAQIVSSGGAYLRYNPASDQARFRFFKSATYSSQSAVQLYKLNAGPTLKSVSLNTSSMSLDVYNNATGSLTATITQDDGVNATLTWSSSNTNNAIVSASDANTATVTALAQGSATITAIATYGDVVKTATCTLTIADSTPIPVTGLSFDKESVTLNNVNNKTTTLTASYLPANANQLTTTWTTSDSDVVTISSTSGSSITITAVNSGVAVVTATCNGYIASCSVTVNDVLVETLTLNVTTKKLFYNETVNLTATITPSSVTNSTLSWETSDSNIASISASSGNSITVTGKGTGTQTATITVRTTDGSNKSATCTITIVQLSSIEFRDLPSTVPYKSTFSLGNTKVYANYSDGTSENVTSSATIDTSAVNTSVLGNKNITASFTKAGTTKEVVGVVKVTNNGAAANVGVSYSTEEDASLTSTFTDKSWGDANSLWNSGKAGNQLHAQGVQIATGQTGANATTKASYNKVSSVVVTYSTNASAGAGSIAVQIGSNSSMSQNITKTGGTSDRNLTFTPSSAQTGTVKFTITCSTNSIYVKSVTINYKKGTTVTFLASPTEQAQAWATYFLNKVKGYCNNNGINSDVDGIAGVWADLKAEYGYMTNESKDAFFSGSTGDIAEAKELYSLIYTKYHASLSNDNFIKDSQDNTLTTAPISISTIINNGETSTILIIVSLLTITAFGAFLFIRKKKEN